MKGEHYGGSTMESDEGLRLLTKTEAAALLSLGESTLDRYVACGWLPRPLRIGNLLRWRADELRAWLDKGCPRGG